MTVKVLFVLMGGSQINFMKYVNLQIWNPQIIGNNVYNRPVKEEDIMPIYQMKK